MQHALHLRSATVARMNLRQAAPFNRSIAPQHIHLRVVSVPGETNDNFGNNDKNKREESVTRDCG